MKQTKITPKWNCQISILMLG